MALIFDLLSAKSKSLDLAWLLWFSIYNFEHSTLSKLFLELIYSSEISLFCILSISLSLIWNSLSLSLCTTILKSSSYLDYWDSIIEFLLELTESSFSSNYEFSIYLSSLLDVWGNAPKPNILGWILSN